MKNFLPENLIALADACALPLYVVGGSVRDLLAGHPPEGDADYDLASPMSEEDFIAACEKCGTHVRAVYPRTGTVKVRDEAGHDYEFTRFRTDRYLRGLHTPAEIAFTDDILSDARRRDFCANAVYYDIRAERYVDPLGGMEDIERRLLRTVRAPECVFGEDGLRLLRLARIAAQTGFAPDAAALAGASANAALIEDIAPERVFRELQLLLQADARHGDAEAPYRGLCILRDTTVLGHTMPALACGEGMAQRSDFHSYDVLEHAFRCVRYAPARIRWAALLHDVGKPFCMRRDGNFHAHAEEGAPIAAKILSGLRAPKALVDETAFLVKMHMRDFDCRMRESKVRADIRACGDRLPLLFALKQADFSACKDDLSPAPTVEKWRVVAEKMRAEGVPMTLGELAVGGDDIRALGVPPRETSRVLRELLDFCLQDGRRNRRDCLLKHAAAVFAGKNP